MANSIIQMLQSGAANNPFTQMANSPAFQMMKMMKNGGNPESVMSMMFGNNPQMQDMMQLLRGKTPQDMESIARNLCKQRGLDYDTLYSQFKQMVNNI